MSGDTPGAEGRGHWGVPHLGDCERPLEPAPVALSQPALPAPPRAPASAQPPPSWQAKQACASGSRPPPNWQKPLHSSGKVQTFFDAGKWRLDQIRARCACAARSWVGGRGRPACGVHCACAERPSGARLRSSLRLRRTACRSPTCGVRRACAQAAPADPACGAHCACAQTAATHGRQGQAVRTASPTRRADCVPRKCLKHC